MICCLHLLTLRMNSPQVLRIPPARLMFQLSASVLQVGRLWTSLADYYIRQGHYESARDVYEEGLTTVITVSPSLPSTLFSSLPYWHKCDGHCRLYSVLQVLC